MFRSDALFSPKRRIGMVLAILASLGACSLSHAADRATLQWELATPKSLPQTILPDVKNRPYLYLAAKSGGVSVLKTFDDGSAPESIATVTKEQLGGLDAMNIYQLDDRLFVALGNFFQRESHAGLAIISIVDPEHPTILSTWKSKKKMRGAAAIVANDTHAFLGGMNYGVIVLDIHESRTIDHVTTFQPEVDFPRENPNLIQYPNARGLALRGKHLYVANDAGGLRVLNIARPAKPIEIAKYINQAMFKKQQAYNNIVLDGRRAFVGIDYAGLEILDISNPRKIRQLGWWNPWKAHSVTNFWLNSLGHVNQVSYDERGRRVFLSAGDSELLVVDVDDSAAPKLLHRYGISRNGLGAWGVCYKGGTAFLTYIKASVPFRGTWAGVKAISIGAGQK